jgi:hypothetical protein
MDDAHERIDAARRAAESELERDLTPLGQTEDTLACAPAFAKFARALYGAEAQELIAHAATVERCSVALEALAAHIVEAIMPDAGLDIVRASSANDAQPPNVIRDVVTGTLWERGSVARDAAYGERGDWERFAPLGVKFFVRRSLYPEANAAVRAALESALLAEQTYWTGQFRLRAESSLSLTPAPSEPPIEPPQQQLPVSDAPPPASGAKSRPHGPSPDYETAKRVAAIVAPFGSQWRSSVSLDNVLAALEEGKIPIPKTWKKNQGIDTWTDAGLDAKTRQFARKAIQHHLRLADSGRKL